MRQPKLRRKPGTCGIRVKKKKKKFINNGFSWKASKIIAARGEEGEPVLDLVGEGGVAGG